MKSLYAFVRTAAASLLLLVVERLSRAEWLDDEPVPYAPTDADDPTPVHDAVAKGLFLEQLEDDDLLAEYLQEWS